MSSFRLRELREDDADAVARLFVEAWGDARPMNGDEIRQRPATNTWVRVLTEVDSAEPNN
jgi:hypothetical protein